jgi:hypothetical protein
MKSKSIIRGEFLFCVVGLFLSFLTLILAGIFHLIFILFWGALFVALFSRGLLDAYRDYRALELKEGKKDE